MKDERVQIVIRSTIEERDIIKERAANENLSMNQFILNRTLDSNHDSNDNAIDSGNDSNNSVVIDVLKTQLESKDKQINKLQTLIDQQQQLTLQSNRQNEWLQLQIEPEQNEEERTEPEQSDSASSKKEKKRGFFERLFNA